MNPRIIFHSTFPSALKRETRAALEPLLPLVQDLEEVHLMVKGAGDEGLPTGEAAILVRRRYHVAHIWLDPVFYTLDEDTRRKTLLHELIHVRLDIFSREVFHVLEHWVPEAVEEYVKDRLEDAEETATDALAHAIDRLLVANAGKLTRRPRKSSLKKNFHPEKDDVE
jgi:hypothetical protein